MSCLAPPARPIGSQVKGDTRVASLMSRMLHRNDRDLPDAYVSVSGYRGVRNVTIKFALRSETTVHQKGLPWDVELRKASVDSIKTAAYKLKKGLYVTSIIFFNNTSNMQTETNKGLDCIDL